MPKAKKRGKGHPVVGLDLGSGSIKLCYIIEHQGQFELKAIDAVELQHDKSSSGRKVAIVQAIRTMLDRNKIKTKRAAFAVSGQVVAIRRLEMPRIADDRMAQIVRYEAEQQIPFDLKDVIWDYYKQDQKSGEMLHVLLVAARKDPVEEVATIAMEAGLEPEIITVNSLAAYSACRPKDPVGQAVAYVDVGANSTDVTIEWEGDVCFSRSIHFAGNRLSEEMEKALGVDIEQAEKIKRRLVTGEGSADEKAALLAGLRRIGMEIQRTLNFFRTESGGVAVERMVVSGGVSMHKEFIELLAEGMGIPVEAGDPFVNVHVPERIKSRIPFPSVASTVVGLGLAGAGFRRTQENLLPDRVKAKKQIRFRMVYVAASVAVAGCIFMGLGILKNTSIKALQLDVDNVTEEIERLNEQGQQIRALNDSIDGLKQKMGRMAVMSMDRGRISDLIVELSRLLAPDTRIVQLSPSNEPGRYVVDVYTPSTPSFTSLVERLKQSPLVEDVKREGEPIRVVLKEGDAGMGAPSPGPPPAADRSSGTSDLKDELRSRARKAGVDVPAREKKAVKAAPAEPARTGGTVTVKAVWKIRLAFKLK